MKSASRGVRPRIFGFYPPGRVAELPGIGAGAPTFQRPGGMLGLPSSLWKNGDKWWKLDTIKGCPNDEILHH